MRNPHSKCVNCRKTLIERVVVCRRCHQADERFYRQEARHQVCINLGALILLALIVAVLYLADFYPPLLSPLPC